MALGPNSIASCTTDGTLPADDDNSTGLVPISFPIDFYGSTYSSLYVNNNGNLTFTGPLGTYTPFDLASTSTPIIAPYFADVDTRSGGGTVSYGTTTFDGHAAFCATWSGVGYFGQHQNKLNSFQVLLVQRDDRGTGEFDIVFNYDQVQWETGDASGGTNGLGGTSATVGYSAGVPQAEFELPGSRVPGSFLDPSGLIAGSSGTDQLGRYVYAGPTLPPPTAPDVAIDSTNPATTGPNDSSTVTWHADQSGTYEVRVDGTDCSDGTVVDSGSYSSPDPVATTVAGSQLSYGDNAVYVCVTNDSESTGSASTSIKLLGIPTPLKPDNASTISGNVATIKWTNVGGETGYQLQYGLEGEGCQYGAPIDVPVDPNPSYTTPALAPGHYCWHVQAVDGNGVSGYDEDFEFYVAASPNVPTLSSPDDGSSTNDSTPTFTWSDESSSGATSYDVQIVARGAGCNFTGTSAINVPSNSYTIPGPLTDGTYCWRAQSEGDGGPSGYSTPFTFTLDTTAPVVTVVSAVPSTVGVGGSSTITWHASEDGSFGVRVGGSDCSSGTQVASGTYSTSPSNTTSTVHDADLAEGPNTVRVCVTDSVSNTGADTVTVTKDTTAPTVPTLQSPADGTTIFTTSTTLQWSNESGSGATSYDVEFVTRGGSCDFSSATLTNVATTSLAETGLSDGTYCWRARAVDALGNASAYAIAFTFTVNTAPVVTIVSAVPSTIGLNGTSVITWKATKNGTYSVRVGGVDCSHGAQVDSGTYSTSPANVTSNVPASSLTAGANTIRVCVTNGGTSFDTTTVTLDATAPTFTNVPSDLTLEATGPSGAVATYTHPTASDVDDAAGPVSCAPDSGSTFPLGTTTVTCSSTDTHGNTGTATFKVTVQDKTPPAINVPADITAEATGPNGAVVTFAASATDAVDGTDPVTCNPASGSTFPLGTTTVNCSSTDSAGNTGHASFKVTVQDTTPPVITTPGDLTVEATGPDGAVVAFTVSATDAVDGTDPATCNPASGSTFPIGATTVDCARRTRTGTQATPASRSLWETKRRPI